MKILRNISLFLTMMMILIISSCFSQFFIQKNKYQLGKYLSYEMKNLTNGINLDKNQKEKLEILQQNIETLIMNNQQNLELQVNSMTEELNKTDGDLQKAFIFFEKSDMIWSNARRKFMEYLSEFYNTLNKEQKIKFNQNLVNRLKFINIYIGY